MSLNPQTLAGQRLMHVHPLLLNFAHKQWSGLTLNDMFELGDLIANFVMSKQYLVAVSGKRLVLAQEVSQLYQHVPVDYRKRIVEISEKLCMTPSASFETVDMHATADEITTRFISARETPLCDVCPKGYDKAQEEYLNQGTTLISLGQVKRQLQELLRHIQFSGLEKSIGEDLHSFVCNLTPEHVARVTALSKEKGCTERESPLFWLTFAFVKFYLDFCGEVEIQQAMKDLEPLKQGNLDTSTYQAPIWHKVLGLGETSQKA